MYMNVIVKTVKTLSAFAGLLFLCMLAFMAYEHLTYKPMSPDKVKALEKAVEEYINTPYHLRD